MFIRSIVLSAVIAAPAACTEETASTAGGAVSGVTPSAEAAALNAPAAADPALLPEAVYAPASASPLAQAIDAVAFSDKPGDATATRNLMIRTQVLLDRARFSPGVIDGKDGENVRQALAAFEQSKNLNADGKMDAETWAALSATSLAPAMMDYVITEADVSGPFVAKIPAKEEEMAKLQRLSYTSPAELLAEKFHMEEGLLKALNPNVDFGKAGQTIVVAQIIEQPLPAVARIEVDTKERELRAYDQAGLLLAVYPATVGSREMPTPQGSFEVRGVSKDPTWNYDPERLNFGKAKRKLTIAAGPNNPVGSIWIALSKDTYGIHGAADPRTVGKAQSHGCVRLTNWDAEELGAAVKPGVLVVFVGEEGPVAGTKA